jgi:phosphoribosylanthranilate isomerase
VRAAEDLADIERLACDAVHLDSYSERELGGTGVVAPWDLIEAHRPSVPFVVSGGLRPENVAEAVRRLRPTGVDVSSGVEVEPGVKDHDAMRAFVEAARSPSS